MPISKNHISAAMAAIYVAVIAAQSFETAHARVYGYVPADCPNIVKQAIDTVSAQCSKTGRGKLCYGNSNIAAQFQPGTNNIQFQAPGDTVDVSAIKQFTLGGMDTATNTWGVAEMKIKADLPDADPSLAVTMIMFGNIQMTDASNEANMAALTQTPGAIAQQNQKATATARAVGLLQTQIAATASKVAGLESTATAYALVPTPTGTIPAVKATQAAANATKLAAYQGTSTAEPAIQMPVPGIVNGPYSSLQAFYFQSGDLAPCDQAPHDGILIQSPQGNKQRVTMEINGATISLGSTVYITAQPKKYLTINVLEGSVQVSAAGQVQAAGPGLAIQVPLDANMKVAGAPLAVQAYTADMIRSLPIQLMSTQIVEAPGLPPGNGQPGQLVNIATEGTVQASSTAPGYPASLAVDGNPATSWFSTGPGAGGSPSTFRWTGKRDELIDSITVLSNRLNSNVSFRTGYGFGAVTIQVLDASQAVVYQTTVDLPGTPDPDVTVRPQIIGRSVLLTLAGHESPNCGGFAELNIFVRQ